MQIHPLAQEIPKPGLPEAAGASVGCSTLQVCAYLTQLPGEAESWSIAPGEIPLVQAVPCTGIAGNNAVDDPKEPCMILEFMPLP